MKLDISPTLVEGKKINLALKVYEKEGEEYSQIAEPQVTTENNLEASIRFTSKSGAFYKIYLTPSIQEK